MLDKLLVLLDRKANPGLLANLANLANPGLLVLLVLLGLLEKPD
jgi:hypothetical protein